MVEEKTKETAVATEETSAKTDEPKTGPKESKQEVTPTKNEKIEKLDDEIKLDLGDATLVLSAEDEVEIAAQATEELRKSESPAVKTSPKVKGGKETKRSVWVSNISKGTKAADLKKIFSEKYKIESAKIVTNGKSLFGYICLESLELAQKMVKDFNGTTLDDRKLALSLSRPDLRSSSAVDNKRDKESRPRVSNGVKRTASNAKTETSTSEDGRKGDSNDSGKVLYRATGIRAPKIQFPMPLIDQSDILDAKQPGKEKEKDARDEEKRRLQVRLQRSQEESDRTIKNLKTDFKRVTIELQNNRRRLTEATRNLDQEKERKVSMRREIEELKAQLKSERRRFEEEIEQMGKKRRSEENRYQEDREMLTRELNKCREVREFLQKKIDDIVPVRHSRSSPRRSDRESDKGHRGRMDSRVGGRSPPPPPKINRRSRSPHTYKGAKKPRVDSQSTKPISYGNSHYEAPSPYSGSSKSLLGNYPHPVPSGGSGIYVSTSYVNPHRYSGSSSTYPGSFSVGTPTPLMSRPLAYPDIRSSGSSQRKY
ncbi:hypothetical protein YQE_12150, partial [Dendroctonus ponderosae]